MSRLIQGDRPRQWLTPIVPPEKQAPSHLACSRRKERPWEPNFRVRQSHFSSHRKVSSRSNSPIRGKPWSVPRTSNLGLERRRQDPGIQSPRSRRHFRRGSGLDEGKGRRFRRLGSTWWGGQPGLSPNAVHRCRFRARFLRGGKAGGCYLSRPMDLGGGRGALGSNFDVLAERTHRYRERTWNLGRRGSCRVYL